MIRYILLTLLFLPSLALSQSRNITIADITNDIALMRREIGQLRLEVEQLRRENESLRSRQSGSVSTDLVSAQNDIIRTEFDAKLQSLKSEIAISTKKDLDAITAQTNTAIQKIINSVEARPKAVPTSSYSADMPSSGILYTVQRGDTLSKIAKKLNSKIAWIQDANQISNPTSIQIGQELVIPQN